MFLPEWSVINLVANLSLMIDRIAERYFQQYNISQYNSASSVTLPNFLVSQCAGGHLGRLEICVAPKSLG